MVCTGFVAFRSRDNDGFTSGLTGTNDVHSGKCESVAHDDIIITRGAACQGFFCSCCAGSDTSYNVTAPKTILLQAPTTSISVPCFASRERLNLPEKLLKTIIHGRYNQPPKPQRQRSVYWPPLVSMIVSSPTALRTVTRTSAPSSKAALILLARVSGNKGWISEKRLERFFRGQEAGGCD